MLRTLAQNMLPRYSAANTKMEKSLIISEVAEVVREQGDFVKIDMSTQEWTLAEDLLVREKISAVFRDAKAQSKRSTPQSFMHKKSMSSRSIQEQKSCTVMPTLEHTNLNQITVPLQPFQNAAPSPNAELHWPSALQRQLPSLQQSVPGPSTGNFGKNDLLSIFSLALADISDSDDPFEPRPIYEPRFEGNRCA